MFSNEWCKEVLFWENITKVYILSDVCHCAKIFVFLNWFDLHKLNILISNSQLCLNQPSLCWTVLLLLLLLLLSCNIKDILTIILNINKFTIYKQCLTCLNGVAWFFALPGKARSQAYTLQWATEGSAGSQSCERSTFFRFSHDGSPLKLVRQAAKMLMSGMHQWAVSSLGALRRGQQGPR